MTLVPDRMISLELQSLRCYGPGSTNSLILYRFLVSIDPAYLRQSIQSFVPHSLLRSDLSYPVDLESESSDPAPTDRH